VIREDIMRRHLVIVIFVLLVCTVRPSAVQAQQADTGETQLVGAWRFTVNVGTPEEFFAVVVFHRDNTMSGSPSDKQLTPTLGVWEKLPGRGSFAATHEFFWDCPFAFLGCINGVVDRRIRVRETIHVLGDDRLTSSTTSDVLSLDGVTQFFQVQGMNEAVRIAVIPE
jgi:hypothetical protein